MRLTSKRISDTEYQLSGIASASVTCEETMDAIRRQVLRLLKIRGLNISEKATEALVNVLAR